MSDTHVTQSDEHFGEHLTIDGYFGDSERLNDRENVRRAIDELPGALGMKKLSTTEVHFAKGNDIKDPGGWSGFVVIEESHISVHTFPAVGFVSIDVYTCRNGLDQQRIVNYFGERFGLQEFEVNFIKRGLRFAEVTRSLIEE
ncbi:MULTISPECIES: adenosylmethionine decarboxylase [Paraburkholderia]|uniref:adenosylmethionine decarboxylase n=1 Tax=Paraburkholderia TaxID=1822464 RepID=UPI0022596849|nr:MULTISPECIES: adenosylmethionine decarboxylase [Paraburkholderia]MCX4162781.1 adenosylmethionine decarboxylase [Paraburkholderia megapolitana]MDN7158276.1 adenosylmethionine decarboxylase [Paraburkholderia sp. CHISQ3]MDQ6495323.1 adenosylmethionine decarboxylase [Paraburkholderia megapolitana]